MSESFKVIDSGTSEKRNTLKQKHHEKVISERPSSSLGGPKVGQVGPVEPRARIPAFGTMSTESSMPTIGSGLGQRDARSAFTPYKPTTILTNLQRGNIQTESPAVLLERTVHHLAAQGELFAHHLDEDPGALNRQDKSGFTPLFWASSHGQLATVNLLLSRNACVSTFALKGESPLLFAAENGHAHIVKELIKHGSNVNHQDQEGNTALMYAAYRNHVLCIHELLAAGTDITKHNQHSEMAYDLAVSRGSKQAQALLEKHIMNLLTR